MHVANLKQDAHQLVDSLPGSADWEDLMYKIYVRQAIETGIADSEAGRVKDVSEVRASFGLPE